MLYHQHMSIKFEKEAQWNEPWGARIDYNTPNRLVIYLSFETNRPKCHSRFVTRILVVVMAILLCSINSMGYLIFHWCNSIDPNLSNWPSAHTLIYTNRHLYAKPAIKSFYNVIVLILTISMCRHTLRSVQVSIIKVASRLPLTVISYTLSQAAVTGRNLLWIRTVIYLLSEWINVPKNVKYLVITN